MRTAAPAGGSQPALRRRLQGGGRAATPRSRGPRSASSAAQLMVGAAGARAPPRLRLPDTGWGGAGACGGDWEKGREKVYKTRVPGEEPWEQCGRSVVSLSWQSAVGQ